MAVRSVQAADADAITKWRPDPRTQEQNHWAALADFSGNMAALDQRAPDGMRRGLVRQPRQRITFDTPYKPARGTTVTAGVDGQQLRVRYAVDLSIDQRLPDSSEAVADAHLAFAERLSRQAGPLGTQAAGLQTDNTFYSATSDGSVFSISAG